MTSSPELLWRCGGDPVLLAGALEVPGLRAGLAARLLQALDRERPGLRLDRDAQGRPLLLSPRGGELDFRVSFSRHAGWLWAAVACTAGLGLDATGPEDFRDPYPKERTFARAELERALRLVPDEPAARALLWALKEAAAKCLGTGFNGLEPRDVEALELEPDGEGGATCRLGTPQGHMAARTANAFGFRLAVAARTHPAEGERHG